MDKSGDTVELSQISQAQTQEEREIMKSTNSKRFKQPQIRIGKIVGLTIFGVFTFLIIFLALAFFRKAPVTEEPIPQPVDQPMTMRVSHLKPMGSFKRKFPEEPLQFVFHPPYKLYTRNHAHYLEKQNVTSVLQIGCNIRCQQIYAKEQKQINVTYASADYKQLKKEDFDWIIIREVQIQHKLVVLAKLAAGKAKKGVTVFVRNMKELRNFTMRYKQFIFEAMKFYGFQHDETGSLNLRRPEGKIPFIFTRNPKKSILPFDKKPMKNNLAIQAVMMMEENLPYLREWIGYHIYLGVDKLFIYDNNGSQGDPGLSTKKQNKYGINFDCLNISQQRMIKEWNEIWDDYYEHIIYVPWQYTVGGRIIYGILQSQGDFMDYFEDVTSYVGFIDTDEMIFSQKNLDLSDFLYWHSLLGHSGVSMMQRKFISRYCLLNQRMIQINQTYVLHVPRYEAEKTFFQMDQFCPWASIHEGVVYRGKKFFLPDMQEFGFNHYNLIVPFIPYFQARGKSKQTRLSYDNSGRERYGELIQKICNGKCSQNFKLICSLQSFRCPEMEKDYFVDPNINYYSSGRWWK